MRRILSISLVLFLAASVFAKDGPSRKARPIFIATTGRIISIDARARTMTVTGSDGPAILQLKSTSPISSRLDEFTVVTTTDTLFQDGADPIRFEDFKPGETVSIHGQLRGATLTASRVAKWN